MRVLAFSRGIEARRSHLLGAPASRRLGRRQWLVSLVARSLTVVGGLCFAWGLYLPAKAQVGQILLRHAWRQTLELGEIHRPWPWADTWPVARLQVPDLEIDQIVLVGAEGDSLAWAPGLIEGSARLEAGDGNVALAGHRDTHFGFLQHLAPGDEMTLVDPTGHGRAYRVEQASVVDETALGVLASTPQATLTLVTCYPFDAIQPGGPLRYVVRAVAML